MLDWWYLNSSPLCFDRKSGAPWKNSYFPYRNCYTIIIFQCNTLHFKLTWQILLGLRRGETYGIRRDDLDLDDLNKATLTVSGTLQYIPGPKGKPGKTERGTTKSASGLRKILLPPSLAAEIKLHIQNQATLRARMAGVWTEPDQGYIFVSGRTGKPLNPYILNEALKECAKEAGLEGFTYHSLRHSCASFLFAAGIDSKRIAAILGHTNDRITLGTYIHLLDQDDTSTNVVAKMLDDDPPEDVRLAQ